MDCMQPNCLHRSYIDNYDEIKMMIPDFPVCIYFNCGTCKMHVMSKRIELKHNHGIKRDELRYEELLNKKIAMESELLD